MIGHRNSSYFHHLVVKNFFHRYLPGILTERKASGALAISHCLSQPLGKLDMQVVAGFVGEEVSHRKFSQ